MKCPYCGSKVLLKNTSEIYHNNKYFGKVWVCSKFPECDAYVSCHKDTTIPMGRLANGRLRLLKKEAHTQFDPIWKSGLMTREDAYKWLSDSLNIPMEKCHIGMFDIKECQKTVYLCSKQTNKVIENYRNKKQR